MWNKSLSLAVLPLHRFISILILMYLEKCSVFVSLKNILAHGKQFLWILQQSCHLIFCVSVTTIKMISTVRFNWSFLDYWYQYKCIEPLRENHMNIILFQTIETFLRIFNDSYWWPAIIYLILLCNTCYKIVLRCLCYQQMLIFIQFSWFPCLYTIIFVWKRKSSCC